jgi:hypothetical protein
MAGSAYRGGVDDKAKASHSEPNASPAAEPQRSGGSGHTHSVLLWTLILALFIYPLSVGPVAKLSHNGVIPEEPARTLYAPLRYLYETCPPVRSFFDWYLEKVWRTH